MIAVDTNVIVRFIVDDDPQQGPIAQQCIARGVFVSHGVLMEAEWVMRTLYRMTRAEISGAFLDLLDLGCVEVDDRDLLRWAAERYRGSGDWTDLLHLIASRAHGGFATFDRALPRQAGKDTPTPIEVLR